jgi:hypothetical protein
VGCTDPQHSAIDQEAAQNTEFPKAGKMLQTFVSALKAEAQSIAGGQQMLTGEEKAQRMSICRECEFSHVSSGRCKKCGCFLKWKTSWRSQKCPIGKW